MPGRPLLLLILFLAAAGAALTAPRPAAAQETPDGLPVRIRADSFRYDRRTRVLTATGNVVLTFQEVTIRADALVANLESGDVTAEGHVQLEVAGQSVSSDLLSYNLATRFGTLTNARTSYTGPLVLGSVHLRAQQLEGIPNQSVTIRGGFLTTCDETDPIVHLTADEITVYLGDRIVGRRVSVWLGGRRLFTLPSFLIFLRERRETRLLPVLGYSEAEGIFVKTTYSYALNAQHYGFLYGDWMERLGVGTGIEHLYQIGGTRGSALVYRLDNRQTGGVDLRAIFNHRQTVNPHLGLALYADYSRRSAAGGPPTSDFFGALDLQYTTPRSNTYLFATAATFAPGSASVLSGRLAHAQALSPHLSVEAFLDLSRVESVAGTDDEAAPRLALLYLAHGVNASLVTDMRWDLDGDRFPFDTRYSLERLPELTVSLAPIFLGGGLTVQLDGGLGRFRETTVGAGTAVLELGRADATITVSGPVPLGSGTLGVRTQLRGSWYSNGASRIFYNGRLEYTWPLGVGVVSRLGYSGQGASGISPFVFDQITAMFSAADATLFYQRPGLFAQATAFYDLQLRRWGRAVAQVVLEPRPGWLVGLAASRDLALGRLDRLEGALDLRLSDEWRFQYVGAYDGFTGRFLHDRVAVTRIFCDCLAMSVSYLGARGEVWLEAWLTAIPWGRGRLGIGQRGNLLFDLPTPTLPRP
ncbi:MAG TPA: LptA/OstA family protein [bacterium]|nr:LptA/OstA family protein [bacterium]